MSAPTVERWQLPAWIDNTVISDGQLALSGKARWVKVMLSNGMPLTAPDRLVLLVLATYLDESGRCWPSLTTIQRASQLARSTVVESLQWLDELGVLQRDQGGPGRVTRYEACYPSRDPRGTVRPRRRRGDPDQDAPGGNPLPPEPSDRTPPGRKPKIGRSADQLGRSADQVVRQADQLGRSADQGSPLSGPEVGFEVGVEVFNEVSKKGADAPRAPSETADQGQPQERSDEDDPTSLQQRMLDLGYSEQAAKAYVERRMAVAS